MSDVKFRALRPDEVEVRASQVSQKGAWFLLYKDARVDQVILDETVGPLNWERRHSRENANCTVSIWDPDKGLWVSKEDTGTESNTEREKGLASDSFKRACFNWGIGRELYTAPRIWVGAGLVQIKDNGHGGYTTYDKLRVTEMRVADGRITRLVLINEKSGVKVFEWGDPKEDTDVTEKRPDGANTMAPHYDPDEIITEKECETLKQLWTQAERDGKVKGSFAKKFPQAPQITKGIYVKAMNCIAGKQ